jgi:hypothetical protein
MRKMTTFAVMSALAGTLVVSVPAQAQSRSSQPRYEQPRGWSMTSSRNAQIRSDINRLRQDIDRAAARRTISRREADRLRGMARDLQREYARYARNGLTWQEVNRLETRVNQIRVALRQERRDWDGRRG